MRDTGGFTVIELIVVTAIAAILALLMMPSLAGYNTNAQVRALASLALVQARQAQMDALAEDQPVSWWIHGNGTQPQNWQAMTALSSATLLFTSVPASLDLTGCYRNTFEPNGTVIPAGPCEGPRGAVLACIDNAQASAPFALQVTIARVTSMVTVQQLTTLCPLI